MLCGDVEMGYYISLILPVLISLIIFMLMIRKGAKKKILIVSAVIGLLEWFASVYQEDLLIYALLTGILGFLIWYITLDLIYRIFFSKQKWSNS
jgi:nucleoside recognition membrane protein YjiH